MRPQPVSAPQQTPKFSAWPIVLLAMCMLLCGVGLRLSTAQSPQPDEREIADTIPKHLPIEVSVKNVNKAKWTSELEVEVKNTGNKPIYFLMLSLFFVDVKMENGDDIGFPLRYGRAELGMMENKATTEDVPIQPGETYVFKAPQALAKNWEKFRVKRSMANPKQIGIRFYALSYGDGTGFHTTGGIPITKPRAASGSYGHSFRLSTAQSPPPPAEREFDNQIPKHLPIKVTVLNAAKVQNLQNEDWLRDLEIAVENRSNKPIYHLLLSVTLADVLTENNRNLTFPLRYGRADLIDHTGPLQADDVPIKPGESYVFKIPQQLQQGWERFATRRRLAKNAPKRVQVKFLDLNFGDGTGFVTTGGIRVPKEQGACEVNTNAPMTAAARRWHNRPPDAPLTSSLLSYRQTSCR